MAALIGRLKGDKQRSGEVTRLRDNHVHAQLETWDGSIRVALDKEGGFVCSIGTKDDPTLITVATGNVNELKYK